MVRKAIVALLLSVAISAPAHAQFQPVTCKNSFTQQEEIAEGNKIVAEVYKQMPVLPDADPISRDIQQLGARLVDVAPLTPGLTQQWPFRFHVVASDEINAFALPGGTMFVNLGAIQAAETESQLVGVMGHEMSHVILRHSTCNLSKQRKRSIWYSLGELGASVALSGIVGAAATQSIGMAQNLDFLRMSRDDEKQADLLGVRIAHDAGYDPRGLPQFFEIIQAKYGSGSAQFLSDHPSPGNRTEYVNREIALLPPLLHPVKTSPQFEAIHNEALGLQALTAEELTTGSWKLTGRYATAPGSASSPAPLPPPLPVSAQLPAASTPEVAYAPIPAPSPTAQRTPLPKPSELPESAPPQPSSANLPSPNVAERLPADQLAADNRLVSVPLPIGSIDAPPNWRMTTQPDGSAAIAPRRAAGAFGISYGVLIGTTTDKGNTIAALTVASDRLTRQLLKTHGLKPNGMPSNLQIAGQPALARELTGASPVSYAGTSLREHDWLITLPRPDGTTAYLLFVAPQPDFATLQPLYDSMLLTFKPQ
jgi:beta-barrel assembly-enhancing protease